MASEYSYDKIETDRGSGSKQTDPVGREKGIGIRETSFQHDLGDVGDARTLGPKKAAYILSPTREAKDFRWKTRKV